MKVSIINLSLDNDPAPVSMDIDPETQLGTLKSLIEVELKIPVLRQEIVINGNTNHDDNATLQSLNVTEHDMIAVRDRQGGSPSTMMRGAAGGATPGSNQSDLDIFRQVARGQATRLIRAMSEPQNLRQLEQQQPALAAAVRSNNVEAVVDELVRTWQSFNRAPTDPRALQAVQNPMSAEAQEYMMEQIRQEAVDENRAFACEVMPEAFGDVVMLYIRVEVNNHPVLAFVDSGAQGTIMSEGCAQRCGLDRIVDRRYQGTATGVGSARVVGRVHLAQIKCGGVFFPASFTILENQSVDLLFGLDLLRRHQCCIDLRKQKLFLGSETSVPFLSEADIREDRDQAALEKLIQSPVSSATPTPSGVAAASTALAGAPEPVRRTDTATAKPQSAARGSRIRQAIESLEAGGTESGQRRGGVHTQGEMNYGGLLIEESKIKQLVDLGFPRDRVQRVLRECRGDTELAAARLAFG